MVVKDHETPFYDNPQHLKCDLCMYSKNNKILLSLYGRYVYIYTYIIAKDLDCDGTQETMEVSCSFATFSGS